MKITIHIDDKEFLFGSKALASAIEEISDSPENKAFFDLLANHPSIAVRRGIARKENISEKTFEMLICSGDSVMVNSLLRGDKSALFMKEEYIQSLIATRNFEILEHIAFHIEAFDISSDSETADFFVNNPNPDIRWTLAGNSRAPKLMLKQLVDDDDPEVRNEAMESLSNSSRLFR